MEITNKITDKELEDIVATLPETYSKNFGKRIGGAKLVYQEQIKRKYRKNSDAYKIIVTMEFTDEHKTDDVLFFIRKYKNDLEKFDMNLNWEASRYIPEQDLTSEEEGYYFTGLPKQRRKIYPFLKFFGFDEEKKISIAEFIKDNPLDVILEKEQLNVWLLAAALDPLVLLMDHLQRYESKLKNLQELKVLTLEDYTKNFCSMLDFYNLSEGEKETVKGRFKELANNYLLNEELETIIQYEGYPWHNDTTHLLHGKFCRGSRGLQFGCLFGHPSVFNKIGRPEQSIYFLLVETYEDFKRPWLNAQFRTALPKLDHNLLEKSFYVGAITGNANLLVEYADYINGKERNELENTIKDQLKILGEIKEENRADEIYKILQNKTLQNKPSKAIK